MGCQVCGDEVGNCTLKGMVVRGAEREEKGCNRINFIFNLLTFILCALVLCLQVSLSDLEVTNSC